MWLEINPHRMTGILELRRCQVGWLSTTRKPFRPARVDLYANRGFGNPYALGFFLMSRT